MIKGRILVGVAALMTAAAIVPTHEPVSTSAERDTRIIIELSKGVEGLTQEEISESQSSLLSRIRNNISNNIKVIEHYSVVANAICVEVNSNDVETIRNFSGVESVTIDKLHERKTTGETYSARFTKNPVAVEENISANTMQKPDLTNDGEGTAIAILDNEFYLRGEHEETEDCAFHQYECDGSAINHEVFDDLDEDVTLKYTFDSITPLLKKGTHAKRKSKATAGQEGSLYFNRKVPFYYDYGGKSVSYGKDGTPDYDVSSALDYHGSHVASITGANAPTYKGIAPKCQLVLMKVFTEYKADEIGKELGFGTSSGAYDSCILNALEDCIILGVDGINMSLGSDLDDFDQDSIALKTLSKLAKDKGIMTAIAAGNSGKTSYSSLGGYANWTKDMVETGIMASYANNKDVMTVASGQPDKTYYESGIKIDLGNGKIKNIAYDDQIVNREGLDDEYLTEYRLADIPEFARNYVFVPGFGTSSDYKGLDVTDKVAVVNRGSTSFADKYKVAKDKGAAALIIINNDPTASDFNFRCDFGDDFTPSMPCALVLFKDKTFFEENREHSFVFLRKEVSDNEDKRTASSFSTDGATYDYDLKPEITAPGENIRGAVPPQTKEEAETPLTSYQYLSGTSMATPNYAGAQALVLSNVTKDAYVNGTISAAKQKEIEDYRKTVDLRIMSTAAPMLDTKANPETNVKNYTSPRIQGAGMVNLNGAINSKVYLEGLGQDGKGIGKSKIRLGTESTSEVAKGNVNISFLAHNESDSAKNYQVELTVMRPAIAKSNSIVSKEYNYVGEIESINLLPGIYYRDDSGRVVLSSGKPEVNTVYKLTKQIEYNSDISVPGSTPVEIDGKMFYKVTMPQGTYYCKSINGDRATYDILPNKDYQSTQDVVIAKVTGQTVTIPSGTSTVTINNYSLSDADKNKILNNFPYGCALEGYVELKSVDEEADLTIPYLGFYSGADKDSTKSYASAPVVEPFEFEKKNDIIYPSDLVNDVTKSLIGKDNVDFGSMWLAGYVKNPTELNVNKVLSNDENFKMFNGFYSVGTDVNTGKYLENPEKNIYVGNPTETNTMIVQQFVLRSVTDNYFTIKNEKGEVVYKSVLEDMLFGEQRGKYPLYKSHVDGSYLSAGYVAHRAYAAIPLYNQETGEAFASGKYEIQFNYLLAATNTWSTLKYSLNIDSEIPVVTKINEFRNTKANADYVRITIKDMKAAYAVVGYNVHEVVKGEDGLYYVELSKEEVKTAIRDLGKTKSGQKRLYIKVYDMAHGYTGVIVHFNGDDYNSYDMVQGANLKVNNDFTENLGEVEFIEINTKTGAETKVKIDGNYNFSSTSIKLTGPQIVGICFGGLAVVTILAGVLIVVIKNKKAKKLAAKKYQSEQILDADEELLDDKK